MNLRKERLGYLVSTVLILCFVFFVLTPNETNVYVAGSSTSSHQSILREEEEEQSTILPEVLPRRNRMPIGIWRPYLQEILGRFPTNFSTEFRNPCWYEGTVLQCAPYFYQLGSYKCGTTDVWDKLSQHPSLLNVAKEPHWWALRRFGFTGTPIHRDIVLEIRNKTGQQDDRSLQWYLNLYRTQAVEQIQNNPKLIFGDASISSLWGLGIYDWKEYFPNETSPPVYLADVLHAVQPNAKLVVILRDPVDRMWSTYMINVDRVGNRTPEDFHVRTQNYFKTAVKCESENSPSYCAFKRGSRPETCLSNWLYQGTYYLYLREWIDVYGLKKIHVMRLEDWKQDMISELEKLIKYLEIEPLTRETITSIVNRTAKNVNEIAKSKHFTMLPSTRRELMEFYRPWNQRLAELLMDQKYTWGY